MGNLFDRIASVPLAQKVGGLIFLLALMCAGYWWFFYSDLQEDKEKLGREHTRLEGEKGDYEKRKKDYLGFRAEVKALLEEQQQLVSALPKDDDIEQFIEGVQEQIDLSGLSKVSEVREQAEPADMYDKIPVKMSLVGSYHQINRFFKQVGEMKRIVNIEDLTLQSAESSGSGGAGAPPMPPPGTPLNLKATFTATTFKFKERKAGPAVRATGTTVKIGGGQ